MSSRKRNKYMIYESDKEGRTPSPSCRDWKVLRRPHAVFVVKRNVHRRAIVTISPVAVATKKVDVEGNELTLRVRLHQSPRQVLVTHHHLNDTSVNINTDVMIV